MEKRCDICGVSFEYSQCGGRPRRYCSTRCVNRAAHMTQWVDHTCEHCGNAFRQDKEARFCSSACHYASKSKPDAHDKHWRSAHHRMWARSVKERDDYTCQMCGVRGGYLHAHHVREWAVYPEGRYDAANGRTLCVSCHHIVHQKRSKTEKF